jgi:hypothetical protein
LDHARPHPSTGDTVEPLPGPASQLVEKAALDAMAQREGRLLQRAGSIASRSASGYEIGPQRYHDPAIWRPNYQLRQGPFDRAGREYREALRLLIGLKLPFGSTVTHKPTGGAISCEQIACMAECLQRPSHYAQRIVEHVAFGDRGGQRWTRDIQMRVPTTARPERAAWRIVPVGQFGRRQLPDLVVRDENNRRLGQLTEDQHGAVLSLALLSRYVNTLPTTLRDRLREPHSLKDLTSLQRRLSDLLVCLGEIQDPAQRLRELGLSYFELLDGLGLDTKAVEVRLADLTHGCVELLDGAPCLCWIEASPGEILGLEVTYTTRDPRHNPDYSGISRSAPPAQGHSYASLRADLDRDLGLGPIKHEFDIPGIKHVGSYSFTISPPEKTTAMYLDWGTGNTLQAGEKTSCSLDSACLNNGDLTGSPTGSRARAFFRVSPHQRVQILAAAALNMAIVLTLQSDQTPNHLAAPLQSFFLAAPSGLIAYLVSQQRHYYAYPLRKQRAVLWGYLTVSIVFFVAVFLSEGGAGEHHGLALIPTLAAWVLFVSSAGILVWYLPLGFGFNRVVAHFTRRLWESPRRHREDWEAYVAVYQLYGRLIFYGSLAAALAAAMFLTYTWHDSSGNREPSPPAPRYVSHGAKNTAYGTQVELRSEDRGGIDFACPSRCCCIGFRR